MRFIERCLWALLIGCGSLAGASAQPVQMAAGSFLLADKGGDKAVPAAPHRSEALVKPTPAGLEVALPTKEVVPTERKDAEFH